ncbi:MAG: tetratricopeptide repeat protein [Nitrospirae bacterium]|nr:tetratricopeptide repeat protein [Nitrospirota bacterium]
MEIERYKVAWISSVVIWSVFSLLFITGCGSVPRISFLHDPLSAEEHLQLGTAYESKGEIDLAISEYQAALKKSKRKKTGYFFMGNAYHQKGDYAEAEVFYRKAIDEDSRFAAAFNNRAWNYWHWGKREEAREAARKAVVLDPDRMEYRDTLKQIVGEETD